MRSDAAAAPPDLPEPAPPPSAGEPRRTEPLDQGAPLAGAGATTPDAAPASQTASSEARGRRPALRPGNQWRRGTARTLYCRTSRAPRGCRGAHHVRDRLCLVAATSCPSASIVSTACRCADSASNRNGIRWRSRAGRNASSTGPIRSLTSSTGWTPRDLPARRSSLTSRSMRRHSTICCFSATGTITRITERGRRRRARSWSRRPSETRRWVCRSSSRFSGASAP